ncbi:hypothetical protein [Senegalia massiliensis]|uniref:hypothetical protein n=1 Tax=Senegalia massiliensis TaxID=1720316 RepID=UPI0013EF04F1|nr:hypothetical protein [Senegalia massiliensis]
MELKLRFNEFISKLPIAIISKKLDISHREVAKLKKGYSVRINSDKLIEFLSNYNSDTK